MERVERKGNFITASFRDRSTAERAYNRLRERGYTDSEINIMMSDTTRGKYFGKESGVEEDEKSRSFGNKAKEGAGVGAGIGGAVGAAAGIIAAIGTSLVIPGLGLIVAGPLAAGLAGAGAGGITGGIVGALVGWGIPEDRAKVYEKDLKEGHIVLSVKPHSETDADYIEEEWRQYEAQDVYR
jgi:hypothetical protein